MKKRILCFGDSNTHGYCGEKGGKRFDETIRWPCILQAELGTGYTVVEEGLNGRTTVFEDPLKEGMCALPYLLPCLVTHEPIDLFVIMLGTNDTKERFSATPRNITDGLIRLLQIAKSAAVWNTIPRILLMAPVPLGAQYVTGPGGAGMGAGCCEKSRALEPLYRQAAEELGCYFLNAADYAQVNTVDFIHLTGESHLALGRAVACTVKEIFS